MIMQLFEINFILVWIKLVIAKDDVELCSNNNGTKYIFDPSRNERFSREPKKHDETLLNANDSCRVPCPVGFTGCQCNIPCASSPNGCPFGCDGYGHCRKCNHCKGGLKNCIGKQNMYGYWIYACADGCEEGWFGNKCDKTCSEISEVKNCAKCRQVSFTYFECIECMAGLYLEHNEINFSKNQDMISGLTGSHIYVIDTGNTQTCIPCNTGCKSCGQEVKCESDTGNCKFGCKNRYEGKKCDNFCRNEKCLQCRPKSSEECLQCRAGWSGKFCAEACNSNCINKICNLATGKCDLGCISGWTGQHCNVTCCQFCSDGKRNECLSCIQEFSDGYCNAHYDNDTKLAMHKITLNIRLPMVTMVTISIGVTVFLIFFVIIYVINRRRNMSIHRPMVADKRQKILQNTYIDLSLKEYFI